MILFVIFGLLSYSSTPLGLEINFQFDSRMATSHIPEIPNGSVNEPPGYPAMKTISFLIGVPQEGKVEWKDSKGYTQYIEDIDIEPVETMSFEGETTKRSSIYKQNQYYPDAVTIEGPFYFRDLRVLKVKIAPIRYNPKLKRIAINHTVKLKIRFKKKGVRRPKRSLVFEPILKELILNYKECQDWRINQRFGQTFFSNGPWYKINTTRQGVYRIGYSDLQGTGINPRFIDPKTIKIYASAFHTLPRTTPIKFADSLVEVPIFFQGEEDGQIDPDDYLIFYGKSANWFTVTKDSINYNLNPYTDTNCFWLTWGGLAGRRVDLIDGSPKGPTKTHGTAIKHLEENKINIARSGLRWLWKEILFGDSLYIKHPGADGPIDLSIVLVSEKTTFTPIKFYIENRLIFDDSIFVGSTPTKVAITTTITGDSSQLKTVRTSGGENPIYLEYIDLSYQRSLKLDSAIDIIAGVGSNHYQISGVTKRPFILDITDQLNPAMIYNIAVENGKLNFRVVSDSIAHLYLTKETITPQLKLSNPGRLRDEKTGADYLIITPKIFKNTVLPLLHYRQKTLNMFDARVMVVTLDEVYDDFAAGRFDPTAIRSFLYYTKLNWDHVPGYVLFVGDGSYDYKNYLGRTNPPNYFPVYEEDASYIYPDNNKCFDDWYATFDILPEMIIGRLPIQNKSQLRSFIKKLFNYESHNYQGDWQNRLLLLADDEYGPDHRWEWAGTWAHAANCESALAYVPKEVEPRKVYSMVYPLEAGNVRPEATKDFIDNLNEGCYLTIYYGHGNHYQIAHEKIFMYEDIARINNGHRNFMIYFGSCGVSRFDDTKWESIGEDLMRVSGAIATLGATRGTSTYPNLILGNKLAEYLWKGYPIGDAVFLAKQLAGISTGRLYQLFTDPATRSIASQPNLTPSVKPDTLVSTSTGTITSLSGFEAIVYLRDSITGQKKHLLRPPTAPESLFTFQLLGSPIHRGRTTSDSLTFSIPRFNTADLPLARVNLFKDGEVGMVDSIPFSTSIPPSADHEGPKIVLYYGGEEIKDSTEIESPATIIGRVEDPAGINIALDDRYSIGEYSFAAILNGDKSGAIDLRRSFVFDLNSYTKGTFRFTLDLPAQHIADSLTITALDNLQNPSDTTFLLFGKKDGLLEVKDFLIYPNPVRNLKRPLSFTFVLSGSGHGDIEIYTVAGRPVARIENTSLSSGFNMIRWQPDDNIGNGVYLAKLTIYGKEGKKIEAIERFIIAR